VTFERAQYFANCWGSELEDAGDAGHPAAQGFSGNDGTN
jgi:predicted alpha/beta hydrolase family esterase